MNDSNPEPPDKQLGISPAALVFIGPLIMVAIIYVGDWIFKLIQLIFK